MTPTLDALRSLAACADHARDAVYALDLAGIGGEICITVVDIDRGKIRLGIEAPRDVPVCREELRLDGKSAKQEVA